MEYYCHSCEENAEVNIMGNTIRCLECGSSFVEEMSDDHVEHADILHQPSLLDPFNDVDGQLEELQEGLSSLLNQYEQPTSSHSELAHSSNSAFLRLNGPGIQRRYNLRSNNQLESNRTNVSNVPHSSGDNSGLRQPSRELAPITGEANENRAPVRVPVRRAAVSLEQPHSLSVLIRNNARIRHHSSVASGRRNNGITQRVPSTAFPAVRIPFRRGAFRSFVPGDFFLGSQLDALLSHLEEQASGNYAVGIEPEELRRLPMTKVSQFHVKKGSQCTTCMETFGLGEEVARLDCHHIFHRECIVPWLVKNNTCPVCRHVADPLKWKNNPGTVLEVSMEEQSDADEPVEMMDS